MYIFLISPQKPFLWVSCFREKYPSFVSFCSCVFRSFWRCGNLAWGGGGGGCCFWCFSCVCSVCACLDLSVSTSSWCLGRAAVCDCGTSWTFLLPFFWKACISYTDKPAKISASLHSHVIKSLFMWQGTLTGTSFFFLIAFECLTVLSYKQKSKCFHLNQRLHSKNENRVHRDCAWACGDRDFWVGAYLPR